MVNTTTTVDELVKLVTDMFGQPLPKEEKSLRRQLGDLLLDFEELVKEETTEKVKETVKDWLDMSSLVQGI